MSTRTTTKLERVERELQQAFINVENALKKVRSEAAQSAVWLDPAGARAAQRSLYVAKENMRHVRVALEKLERQVEIDLMRPEDLTDLENY